MIFLMNSVAAAICALLMQSPEEIAVRAVVQKYVEAREHESPQEIEALFSPDADQLVSSGEWRRGREAVVRGTLASSRASGGKRTITVISVRFVTAEVAVADGQYDLTGLPGGVTRRMWTTLILTRSGTQWRIAAIRNMLPAAPVPPGEGTNPR